MWRQSRKASNIPSSQRNMQILQEKGTFSQGMHKEKCKTDSCMKLSTAQTMRDKTYTYDPMTAQNLPSTLSLTKKTDPATQKPSQ